MVDEINKTGVGSGQNFSNKGVKLETLKKENEVLFNYFKKAGYKEGSYIFESDIAKIKEAYDKNKNGELSVKEAKAMGLDGKNKDIKNAIKYLEKISATEINPDELVPVAVDENGTNFYKNGVAQFSTLKTFENGQNVVTSTGYRDGNPDKISFIDKLFEDGQFEYTEFDEDGRAVLEEKGNKITKTTYDGESCNEVIEENLGNGVIKKTTSEYSGGKLTYQAIEGDPKLAEQGIDMIEREFSDSNETRTIARTDGSIETKEFIDGEEVVVEAEPLLEAEFKDESGKPIKVEYDGEGNTYVYVKEGESFKMTAKRVLGKDATEEQIAKFRELNAGLIKKFGKNKNVEAFHVGAKIRVPGELAYNEDTKEILSIKSKDEIAAYTKAVGGDKPATGNTGKADNKAIDKPDVTKTDETKEKENVEKPVNEEIAKKATDAGYRATNNENVFYDEKTKTHQIWNAKQGKFLDLGKSTVWTIKMIRKDGVFTTKEGSIGKFEFDDNGQLKTEVNYHKDTNPLKASGRSEYDANGNIRKKTQFDKDGKVTNSTFMEYDVNGIVTESWTYEYDANGKETKRTYLDKDGKVTASWTARYDANGNMIKEILRDENGKVADSITYEYDANGNRTKETIFDENGKVTRSRTNEYDANGNETKETIFDKDGKVTRSWVREDEAAGKTKVLKNEDGSYTMDEYDAKGNKTKSTDFDKDGKPTYSATYEYDAKGNQTKWTTFDSDGKVKEYSTYEYDAKGNQTKWTNFDKDGKPTKSMEREYDANGNETKWTRLDGNGNIIQSITDEFDADNKVIKRTEHGKDGKFKEEISYYDFMNDKIRERRTPNNRSTYDQNGNLTACDLAKELYDQLKGASLYSNTKKVVDKIDKDNVADVIERFNQLSSKEPLFTYINNEWKIGKENKYSKLIDHIYNSLIDYAKAEGININWEYSKVSDGHYYSDEGVDNFNSDTNKLLAQIIEKRKAQYAK